MTIVIVRLRPQSAFRSLEPTQWCLLRSGLENPNKADCAVLPDCSWENMFKKTNQTKQQKNSQIYVKAWPWLEGCYTIKLNCYYGLCIRQKLSHSRSPACPSGWQDACQLHQDTAQPHQFSIALLLMFPASPRGLMHYTQGICTGCLGSGSKQVLTYILT